MEQTTGNKQLSWTAKAVIALVNRMRTVSFVEIEDMLASHMNTKGDMVIHLPHHPTIILWTGMSKEFVDAMFEAIHSKRIDITPSDPMVYLFDGAALNLPLAKTPRQYKEPHWLPVVFNPRKEDKPAKKRR